MPADQIARTTVAARLGTSDRRPDGLEVYAALEYRREDLHWLRTQTRVSRQPRASLSGWLSRSWWLGLLARNPATEVESSPELAAP